MFYQQASVPIANRYMALKLWYGEITCTPPVPRIDIKCNQSTDKNPKLEGPVISYGTVFFNDNQCHTNTNASLCDKLQFVWLGV